MIDSFPTPIEVRECIEHCKHMINLVKSMVNSGD